MYREIATELDTLQFARGVSTFKVSCHSYKKRMGATAPSQVATEIRFDEKNHLVMSWQKQIRYVHGDGKMKRKCDAGFQVECFVRFHEK